MKMGREINKRKGVMERGKVKYRQSQVIVTHHLHPMHGTNVTNDSGATTERPRPFFPFYLHSVKYRISDIKPPQQNTTLHYTRTTYPMYDIHTDRGKSLINKK